MEEKIEKILDNLVRSQLLDAIGDVIITLSLLAMIMFFLWLANYVKNNKQKENKEDESKDE